MEARKLMTAKMSDRMDLIGKEKIGTWSWMQERKGRK